MGNGQVQCGCFTGLSRPCSALPCGTHTPTITLGIWKFRGLGAPLRMMCVYSRVRWEENRFELRRDSEGIGWVSVELEQRKKGLRQRNPLIRIPYVMNNFTNQVVSQTIAVFLYLGRVLRLDGSTGQGRSANEQILCFAYNICKEISDQVYPFNGIGSEQTFKACLGVYFGKVRGYYEQLEAWLRHMGTPYFAGSKIAAADFLVWEMLDQHEAVASQCEHPSPLFAACGIDRLESELGSFDLLKAFFRRVRQEPRLQPYFEGDDYKLPLYNVMAFVK